MWTEVATVLVTFLVIIDPVGLVPIFMSLTSHQPPEKRRHTAQGSILAAATILTVFAIVGKQLLPLLGITLPALQISGGVLLMLLSIEMVFARQSGLRSTTDAEKSEAQHKTDVTIFPLAVPLIAGPGAITSSVMLMERAHGSLEMQAIVVLLMLSVLALTYLAFLGASRLMGVLGVTGINVIGRTLGIILAALAVQFMIEGLQGAFPSVFGAHPAS
jgi:multiple antibiotic resistance protein